jgi:hypothetical protein
MGTTASTRLLPFFFFAPPARPFFLALLHNAFLCARQWYAKCPVVHTGYKKCCAHEAALSRAGRRRTAVLQFCDSVTWAASGVPLPRVVLVVGSSVWRAVWSVRVGAACRECRVMCAARVAVWSGRVVGCVA